MYLGHVEYVFDGLGHHHSNAPKSFPKQPPVEKTGLKLKEPQTIFGGNRWFPTEILD